MITIKSISRLPRDLDWNAEAREALKHDIGLVEAGTRHMWMGEADVPLFVAGVYKPSVLLAGEFWIMFTRAFRARHFREGLRLLRIPVELYPQLFFRTMEGSTTACRFAVAAGLKEIKRYHGLIEYKL